MIKKGDQMYNIEFMLNLCYFIIALYFIIIVGDILWTAFWKLRNRVKDHIKYMEGYKRNKTK